MNIQEQEERDFTYASRQDWDRAEAREIGSQNPHRAYINTGNDVWHVNPFWGKYDKFGNPLQKEAHILVFVTQKIAMTSSMKNL